MPLTLRRVLVVLALAVGAGCVVGPAMASAAKPRPTPELVPGTQLTGAGAFMGPVHRMRVGSVKLGYRQFGHGPDLLMITGDTAPMSLWMPYLLEPLSREFRVTIFDNRGVGYSTDDLSQRMSVPLMARDTVRLIRALGLRRATVVGWSMGGEIGLTMAVRYRHSFARLVTSGGDAGSRHTVPPPPGLIGALSDPNNVQAALELLFPPSPAGQSAQQRFIAGYLAVPQEPVSSVTLQRQARAENAFLRNPRVWNRLDRIRVPVLVTNGELDQGVPPVNARNLARRIPRARLSIYAGAAHGMMFQDAERFAAQVTRFSSR
jgi:pimeloyl-ACP methyl ester carboxylesterase